MKRILAKCLAAALIVLSCFSFSSCKLGEAIGNGLEKLLFCDIRLEGEPTMTVIEEEDGEYTIIVEGYAKNHSDKMAYRCEAVADFYDEKGEFLEFKWRFVDDIGRIDQGEIWRFYIARENVPVRPTDFRVIVFEDW